MSQENFDKKNARVKKALSEKKPYVLLIDANQQEPAPYVLHYALILVGTDRVPLPIVASWFSYRLDRRLATGELDKVINLIGYPPVMTLPRDTKIESDPTLLTEIVQCMIASIEDDPDGEGYWHVTKDGKEAIIRVRLSRNPNRSSNGGDYDYYREFNLHEIGVVSLDTWSADFVIEPNETLYKISIVDLRPIFEQAAKIATNVLVGEKSSTCPCCGRPYTYQQK